MDIGSEVCSAANELSNLQSRRFVFEGVKCCSMEGLLASFKFERPEKQIEVCRLSGLPAKFKGKKRNKAWKSRQKLWWQGQEFDRHGSDFQSLLDRAFLALATNTGFRQALLATGDVELTHSIGKDDACNTVLTREEFCSRLTRLRERMKHG